MIDLRLALLKLQIAKCDIKVFLQNINDGELQKNISGSYVQNKSLSIILMLNNQALISA